VVFPRKDGDVFNPGKRLELTDEAGRISPAVFFAANSASYKVYHNVKNVLPWAALLALSIAAGKTVLSSTRIGLLSPGSSGKNGKSNGNGNGSVRGSGDGI